MFSREITIIPNEELLTVDIYNRKIAKEERHAQGIEEFSNLYHLGLNFETVGVDHYNGYMWGIALAKLGHLSLQFDNHLFICIPDVISANQYQFMKKYRRVIQRYGNKIHAAIIVGENVEMVEYQPDGDRFCSPVSEIYIQLENKYHLHQVADRRK